MAKQADAVPRATTGSRRTDSGRNGSGATVSRQANSKDKERLAPSSASIGGAVQG